MAPDRHSLTELHLSVDDDTGDPITEGFVPVADGAGRISWGDPTLSPVPNSMVPYYIPADQSFTVPEFKQALFKEPIEVDGSLVISGMLLEVD